MRPQYWILTLFILCGCKDKQQASQAPQNPSEALTEDPATAEWKGYALGDFVDILTPVLDPAKLDTLKGKRAATPRLRKACYWLQTAHTNGFDIGEIIDLSHDQVGPVEPLRAKAQRASLIRNRVILERLGCFDEAGMTKLRKGNAPTITKGPYAGEIVTGDHIIPRSVCPELDNKIYNLEMMPLTLNQRKGAKVTQRQIDLAKRWNQDGLLSDAGLGAVLEEDPRAANMEKQAVTYQELAEMMNQLSEGKDVPLAADKVSELVAQMMTLKKESNSMVKPEGDAALEALQNNKAYSEAVKTFFEATNKLTQSGKMTAEIFEALQGRHQAPEPD